MMMRILRVLHTNRLAVLLGSALLCLAGFVAGCDSGSGTVSSDPQAVKAKEQAEGDARRAAYGKTGNVEKAGKAKPKS